MALTLTPEQTRDRSVAIVEMMETLGRDWDLTITRGHDDTAWSVNITSKREAHYPDCPNFTYTGDLYRALFAAVGGAHPGRY